MERYAVYRHITPCNMLEVNRRFGGTRREQERPRRCFCRNIGLTLTRQHGVVFQKVRLLITTAAITSDPAQFPLLLPVILREHCDVTVCGDVGWATAVRLSPRRLFAAASRADLESHSGSFCIPKCPSTETPSWSGLASCVYTYVLFLFSPHRTRRLRGRSDPYS
jgi:hypothetical protein